MKKLYSLFLLFFTYACYAGNFTPGNLVVVRLGTGSAALSSAATAVFLDEYSPAGTLVQSVALPTAVSGNNHSLTLSGTATSEGSLTLSVNGQLLTMAGYDAAPGLASVASDSTTNRTIAVVGANTTINTSTGIVAGSAYKKNNIRGAVTNDGTAFWCSGAGSGTSGGSWYLPSGAFTSSPVDISSTISSTRAINIFGGQLYASSSSSTFHGVNSIGTGLPVISSQTSVNLAGMPGADTASSAYGFYFFDMDPNTPGVDVVYVCDDRTAASGGILKYSLVGGSWVPNGNISSQQGLRGVTGYATCKGVQLYISGTGGVYSLKDTTGYNHTISGTLNQLITPSTNTIIRGIAFAPGTTPPANLQASLVPTNISCNGAANGGIVNTVSGGTTPYSYLWSNNATTQNIGALSSGSYTITVSDAGGCSVSAGASVSEPTAISAVPTATNATCNGGTDGSITLNVSGGTTNYTYSWTNGATTQSLSALGNGTYTVTVTDAHLCTVTASALVSQPNAIVIAPTVTNLPCTGGANTGAINISVNGGTGAYTYSWSSTTTTQNITGLNAGTFTVTVTDASHCTASQSAIVSQSGSLSLSVNSTNVKCYGGSTGAITVTASGGTPAYNYSWSTGNNNQPQSGLGAGTYTVTVTDNGGCTLTNSISITQPAVLAPVASATNVTCYAQNNGAVNLSVNGGTVPYTFSWSNSTTAQSPSNLSAATYTVTVTDSNSCSATAQGIITQPDSISISAAVTNATSFGATDGSIALTVSGGTTGYSYAWNSGSGVDNTSLAAGQYCVTVTDAHTCAAGDCYTVTQPTGINEAQLTEKFVVYATGDNLFLNAMLKNVQTCHVQITDITGRVVFKSTPASSAQIQMQIMTGSISSGCYIVTLIAEQGNESQKIIVTR